MTGDDGVSNATALLFTLAMFAAAIWLVAEAGIDILLSIITFLLLVLLIYTFREPYAKKLKQVDEMSGEEFERLVARLLRGRGYDAEVTATTGDLGVDVGAQRGSECLAVQVKRQDKPVSRRAVSDAVAGMPAYECTAAMVVTNSHFTDGARSLAELHECELVDRDHLETWLRGGAGLTLRRIVLLVLFLTSLAVLIHDSLDLPGV